MRAARQASVSDFGPIQGARSDLAGRKVGASVHLEGPPWGGVDPLRRSNGLLKEPGPT